MLTAQNHITSETFLWRYKNSLTDSEINSELQLLFDGFQAFVAQPHQLAKNFKSPQDFQNYVVHNDKL